MELETYEANLADIALQEQTFYDIKPTAFELQMASQLMSNNHQNGGHYQMSGGFPLLTPILNTCGKGKKKKSVKFLTYVQVSIWLKSIVCINDISIVNETQAAECVAMAKESSRLLLKYSLSWSLLLE